MPREEVPHEWACLENLGAIGTLVAVVWPTMLHSFHRTEFNLDTIIASLRQIAGSGPGAMHLHRRTVAVVGVDPTVDCVR
jgi:hypothetical protein